MSGFVRREEGIAAGADSAERNDPSPVGALCDVPGEGTGVQAPSHEAVRRDPRGGVVPGEQSPSLGDCHERVRRRQWFLRAGRRLRNYHASGGQHGRADQSRCSSPLHHHCPRKSWSKWRRSWLANRHSDRAMRWGSDSASVHARSESDQGCVGSMKMDSDPKRTFSPQALSYLQII